MRLIFLSFKNPKYAVTGDFDRDGRRDIVSADQDSKTISVLLGNGDGTFKPKISFPACNGDHEVAVGSRIDIPERSLPKSVEIGDVNGDGHPEIIVTNTTYPTCCTFDGSTISVFLNRGSGTFEPRLNYFSGGNPFPPLVRDLNGDGKVEVATANFIDQTAVQHAYLQAVHALGLTSR